MERLLDDDRVRQLIHEAEDAARLVAQLQEDGADARDVQEALDGIWRDLGRLVHARYQGLLDGTVPVSQDAPTELMESRQRPLGSVTAALDDNTDTDIPRADDPVAGGGDDLERWYTDEIDLDGRPPLSFSHADGADDVPESDSDPLIGIGTTEGLVNPITSQRTKPVPAADLPAWLGNLDELMRLLELPRAGDDDPARLAEEASKVQWATSGIEVKWADYPVPIQTALIGMLAARCRALQERLDTDVGPRLAMERLRRYRKAAGLPPVTALSGDRGPETGSWSEDARRWYEMLAAGMK